MPIFGLGWTIPVKSHLCKFGSDWLSLSRVIVSTNIFLWGRDLQLGGGGVTSDLWCPFLNSDELFQSKVMCGNLVWIGWNRRYVNFELGRGCLDKSHVWKFGSDWLRLSRVIVGTNQMTCGRGRVQGQGQKNFKVKCRSSPIGAFKNLCGLEPGPGSSQTVTLCTVP